MSRQQKTLLSFFLVLTFFISTINTSVHAQKQQSFEESWYDIGYKSVGEAITECNKLFKRNVILPTRLPTVEFTHQFGRCNKSKYRVNNSFEIEYINQGINEKHYRITVRPLKYRIQIEQHKSEGAYTLKDKTTALLFRLRDFKTLVFEKNGWQYMLTIDGRGLHTSPSEALVQIANTIK